MHSPADGGTSALLSRPKNISEEMALALANFCRASLDSATGSEASGFLLLGNLKTHHHKPLNILQKDQAIKVM